MKHAWQRTGVVLTLLGIGVWAGASVAEADETTPADIMVILAKETPGEKDPSLANIPALGKPPFNSFQSMRVLSRSKLALGAKKAVEIALPNGRRLRLTLEQITADKRFKVRVAINRPADQPNQADYLPLLQVVVSPGEPFFVAGQSYEGGTLVIGIRVGVGDTSSDAK